MEPKFDPGSICATPAALEACARANCGPWELLQRHLNGDWGTLTPEDRDENERALIEGNRLLSAYVLRNGEKLWIITEADRSVTTILLPDDY